MTNHLPTMPVGVDRYLADTAHLTPEEQGLYFRLQIYAWRSPGCCLPDDDARLARMLGISLKRWASLKPSVMALWTLTDDGWVNDQVAREHEFVSGKVEKKRAAGKLGGRPKSLKNNDTAKASGSENGKQNESELKAATATATKTLKVPKGTDAGFERFRAAFPPKHVSFPTTQARKRYDQAIKAGATPDEIEAGAKAYAAEQLRIGKSGTEYVKSADSWLHQRRWLDYAHQDVHRPGAAATKLNPEQDRRHRLRLAIDHFRDEWRQGTDEQYRPGTAGCTTPREIVEEARLAVATERILTERPLATNAA
ncbi:MAG: DUF1376 domain-containing protein [Methylobacterium sp.]|uniref:DUF1376 domain-containing protein n=1 Tax=Methylobacterium sp. TaxID=409 RepID=UPI00271561B6|nr:DUF1376 domain-containing protein [Methylobacterium sp.]MDO9428421.1 DUF1376 domain-containing protein [Methylobacterium sp.]